MNFQRFKETIVDYLKQEKKFIEEDIENNKLLDNKEKEDKGLLIQSAQVVGYVNNEYKFSVLINNTKLRPGDKVVLHNLSTQKRFKATIIENDYEFVYVTANHELPLTDEYNIEIEDFVLLDPLIELAEKIREGTPGAFLFRQLAGESEPLSKGLGKIPLAKVETFPETLNKDQYNACLKSLDRPSILCIQGPPGTGKTDVLSTIAHTFNKQHKDVLIISNTHQAVNNALNKISRQAHNATVVKIGEELKAQELDDNVILVRNYREFSNIRKNMLKTEQGHADIVGMTYHSAILQLGMKNSGFKPSLVLVDEAGQMPLTQAALIGAIGCGSLIFIGDDKQMPPIYHEKLSEDPFSISIFSYLCNKFPDTKERLTITYRMNEEITNCISRNFYETDGEKLISSALSKNRKHRIISFCEDERIKKVLGEDKPIQIINVSQEIFWEDTNEEEANFIAKLIAEAFKGGMKKEELAVITPYRRQVKAIRSAINKLNITDIPLIDTVERLQGQDVDMIIISFCAASPLFCEANKHFILNHNRLNVMISRAKKKVVLLASHALESDLRKL